MPMVFCGFIKEVKPTEKGCYLLIECFVKDKNKTWRSVNLVSYRKCFDDVEVGSLVYYIRQNSLKVLTVISADKTFELKAENPE